MPEDENVEKLIAQRKEQCEAKELPQSLIFTFNYIYSVMIEGGFSVFGTHWEHTAPWMEERERGFTGTIAGEHYQMLYSPGLENLTLSKDGQNILEISVSRAPTWPLCKARNIYAYIPGEWEDGFLELTKACRKASVSKRLAEERKRFGV
jgi:hypothetical protein